VQFLGLFERIQFNSTVIELQYINFRRWYYSYGYVRLRRRPVYRRFVRRRFDCAPSKCKQLKGSHKINVVFTISLCLPDSKEGMSHNWDSAPIFHQSKKIIFLQCLQTLYFYWLIKNIFPSVHIRLRLIVVKWCGFGSFPTTLKNQYISTVNKEQYKPVFFYIYFNSFYKLQIRTCSILCRFFSNFCTNMLNIRVRAKLLQQWLCNTQI
jgi:hypothetical protein